MALSKIATNDRHGENSPYFDGWKAYDANPYHPTKNRGVIQMCLVENQVWWTLILVLILLNYILLKVLTESIIYVSFSFALICLKSGLREILKLQFALLKELMRSRILLSSRTIMACQSLDKYMLKLFI
jgi:hypothetical protein